MSNVIQFLESLGNKSALSNDAYAMAIVQLDTNDAERQALMERDHAGLNALLGGRENVMCMVATPIDEDWKNDDEKSEFVQNS